MTPIPAQFWLEKSRLWVQGGWFCFFGLALWLSILSLTRPNHHALRGWSRGLWVAAMLWFVAMWMAGPILELVRRAVLVSRTELILALGAFSILLAGVLSLVREWFGRTGAEGLRGERLALSLLVFTLAGWWFGGFSLPLNSLWSFAPSASPRPMPDGWALSLSGATLLGLSNLVQTRLENRKKVCHPRAATWWIVVFALALWLPWRGQNVFAASAFLAAAGTFTCKMWRARAECPRFLRVNVGTRGVLILLVTSAPFWFINPTWPTWNARLMPVWKTPLYSGVFLAFLLSTWALLRARRELREAIDPHFSPRLLLHGTIAGTLTATLLFGPAGTPFFAFWPLCGLFFDLLAPREYQREDQPAFRSESEPEFEVAAANGAAP